MNQSISKKPRGFTLMETTMALALIGLFLSVATQIFHTSFKLIEGAASFDTQASRLDHALAALRRDVWNSQRQTASAHELSLEFSDDRRVVWSASESDGLTRTERIAGAMDDERHWPQLTSLKFEGNGPTVTLIVVGKSGDERVEMVAPMLLLETRR